MFQNCHTFSALDALDIAAHQDLERPVALQIRERRRSLEHRLQVSALPRNRPVVLERPQLKPSVVDRHDLRPPVPVDVSHRKPRLSVHPMSQSARGESIDPSLPLTARRCALVRLNPENVENTTSANSSEFRSTTTGAAAKFVNAGRTGAPVQLHSGASEKLPAGAKAQLPFERKTLFSSLASDTSKELSTNAETGASRNWREPATVASTVTLAPADRPALDVVPRIVSGPSRTSFRFTIRRT